jgi:hypothetical protein
MDTLLCQLSGEKLALVTTLTLLGGQVALQENDGSMFFHRFTP